MSDGKDEDEIVAPASVEIFNPVNESKEETVEIQNPKATEIATPTLTGTPQMGIPQLNNQSLDSSDYKKSLELNNKLISFCERLCLESKKLKNEIENLSKK